MTDVANENSYADKENKINLVFDPSALQQPKDFAGPRHQLKHTWTLYYDAQLFGGKRPPQAQWGDNIKEVYTFNTVEDFWRMHNNLASPSQIQSGCTFSLFKKGIQPKWEDPKNAKGGKWTIMVNKGKGQIDQLWLWIMLACIGEVLEDEGQDDICGCVVNIRKNPDKINLWTSEAQKDETILRIGQRLRSTLELTSADKIQYLEHDSKGANKYEL